MPSHCSFLRLEELGMKIYRSTVAQTRDEVRYVEILVLRICCDSLLHVSRQQRPSAINAE